MLSLSPILDPSPQLRPCLDQTRRLPDHVLLLIFKYFNAYECLNLSTVCWRWYSVIQTSPMMWKTIWFLRPAQELVDCPLLKRELDVGKYLRRLTIDRAGDLDLLVCLLQKAGCGNIESLSKEWKHVSFGWRCGCRLTTKFMHAGLLGDPQRQLFFPITFTLTPLAVDFICWLGPSLTTLEVAFGVDMFLDTSLARILSSCSNLKSLSIYGTRQNLHDPVSSYERISEQQEFALTHLHLEIRRSRLGNLIQHLLPLCPLLEEFILEDHDGPVVAEEWNAISRRLLPKLKTFVVNLCDTCIVTEYHNDDDDDEEARHAEIIVPYSHIPAYLQFGKRSWKSLRIRIEYQEHLEEIMSHVFRQCSQVEELELYARYKTEKALKYHDTLYDIYGPIPQHMPKIRHLTIGGYAVLSGYIINMTKQARADGTLPYLQKISVVDLVGRAAYSRSWFVDLVSLPSVHSLEITNCQNIITRDHIAFLTDSELENVILHDVRLDDEWLDALEILTALKSLEISDCSGVTDAFLRQLICSLPTLSTLLLRGYRLPINQDTVCYAEEIMSNRGGSFIYATYSK